MLFIPYFVAVIIATKPVINKRDKELHVGFVFAMLKQAYNVAVKIQINLSALKSPSKLLINDTF